MLAIGTAVGCIAYEKLVKQYSYGVILWLIMLYCVPALAGFVIFDKGCASDIRNVTLRWNWPAFVFFSTSYTSILWYIVTKRQSVMAAGIYELKYIVVLAVVYLLFGDKPISSNLVIGLILSLGSIYFISK